MPAKSASAPVSDVSSSHSAGRYSVVTEKAVDRMRLSVIVPTYNEEKEIGPLVKHLLAEQNDSLEEVLVINGGSTDQTVAVAQQAGAQVHIAPLKGRANQMNFGVSVAQGDVLYFVHADTCPPAEYVNDIRQSLHDGHDAGCYRSRFCSSHPMLKLNSYFSRFGRFTCRGGDQTLFVTRSLFDQLRGYDNYYIVMEDFNLIRRIQRRAQFQVIPKEAYVSARKYDDNSYGRVTLANFIVFTMFRLGVSPQRLLRTYKKMVKYPKY